MPPVPATAVHDCLSRLPARQVVDRVGGLLLWLPRLGVTVLPHEPVTGGWVCTLVAVDAAPPGWLPAGVFEVSDLELRTAIATINLWLPTAEFSTPEFCDAWRVRFASHGANPRIGAALLSGVDPLALTVDTADPALRTRAGCRHPGGFAHACRRLREAGLLRALIHDTIADRAGSRRYGLALPPAAATDWMGR